MDGISRGFGERLGRSNSYFLHYEIKEIPEGEDEFSFLARDYNGNISGTFRDDITTIDSRKNKKITILPEGAFTPYIMSPRRESPTLVASMRMELFLKLLSLMVEGLGFLRKLLSKGRRVSCCGNHQKWCNFTY